MGENEQKPVESAGEMKEPVIESAPTTAPEAPVATPVVVVGTPATPTPVATVVTAPASGKKSKFKLVKFY